jgi:ABC-type sugar transport system ATPase subunit
MVSVALMNPIKRKVIRDHRSKVDTERERERERERTVDRNLSDLGLYQGVQQKVVVDRWTHSGDE